LQTQAQIDLPDWHPPEAGDAGTMLQVIYARLLEIALERFNQVPDKNLLAFLETMAVQLLPPSPARVPLTFGLTPGSALVRVPQGTQAGAKPDQQQAGAIFETDDDFTVLPAQLVSVFTMDPTWDRYSDLSGVVGGQSAAGFTPFVGTQRMPHVLYFGDEALLNFSRATIVEIIDPAGDGDSSKLGQLLQSLQWQYKTMEELREITATMTGTSPPTLSVPSPIDRETIQGVGLSQSIQSYWLRATLKTPLPYFQTVYKKLRLGNLQLKVTGIDLLPDLAFSNTTPVDISKDFRPLGEKPRVGDAFYFSNEEVLSKPGADIRLQIELRRSSVVIAWEYFAKGQVTNEWLPVLDVEDETDSFQISGKKLLLGNLQLRGFEISEGTVNGISAFWLRARVISGNWWGTPKVTGFFDVSNNPPNVGLANNMHIDFGNPFAPFGERPGIGSTFYFGFTSNPGDSVQLKVNQVYLEPRVNLSWEYCSNSSWSSLPQDEAASRVWQLTEVGTVGIAQFTCPEIPREKVNGQEGRWIRVRVAEGDCNREAEYIPVDPDDPSKGFKLAPGTGSFAAPVISSFKISYEFTRHPTILRQTGFLYEDFTPINQGGGSFAPFIAVSDIAVSDIAVSDIAVSNPSLAPYNDSVPALYLGLDAAFPEQPVSLYVAVTPPVLSGRIIKGTRSAQTTSTELSPLQWEYFNGTTWHPLTVFDGTHHFTESGPVEFLTPPDIQPLAKFDPTERYWIRVRSKQNHPFDTQRLQGIFLNTVPATQAITVTEATLGSSNGLAGQTCRFTQTPVLPGQAVLVREPEAPPDRERQSILRDEGETAIQSRPHPTTGEPEIWVRWHEVANFLASDRYSRHYTLDRVSGTLQFGDGQRGMIPPRGTNNIIATYRTGGGAAGNVAAAAVTQIKTPQPGLASVTNPIAADGGADAETVPMVKQRGPQTLRHRDRAITSTDLEWLARQAVGTRIARAKCLPNLNRELRFEPGWVTLVIVPQGQGSKLLPSAELIRDVNNYLETRAFAGLSQSIPSRINVIGPGYIPVAVEAQIVPRDLDDAQLVKQQAIAALNQFFHPLTGGPEGKGWVFGRDVYVSEVCRILEEVPGVSYVNQSTQTVQLLAQSAQYRLSLTSSFTPSVNLPVGSIVMTENAQKMALLAEPLSAGVSVTEIAVKGLQAGDRITRSLDVVVETAPEAIEIASEENSLISISVIPISDLVAFPAGSVVMTFDGTYRTRLQASIEPVEEGETPTITKIHIKDPAFPTLEAGDRLTILYPFPFSITSVSALTADGGQSIGIEPYLTDEPFPGDCLLSTLDNRIRLPLSAALPGQERITSITLTSLIAGETIRLHRPDRTDQTDRLTIREVQPITDIVYLDDNYLPCPGAHQITIVAD
jgi:uncharacterized phage protein gp47/JayE